MIGLQEKSKIEYSGGLEPITKVFEQKANYLGKKPKQLRINTSSENVVLSYEFDFNLGGQTTISSNNENTLIELETSYLVFSRSVVIILVMALVGFGIMATNNEKIEIPDEIFMLLPIAFLVMYLQLKVNLNGLHKTSIQLVKRSINLTDE